MTLIAWIIAGFVVGAVAWTLAGRQGSSRATWVAAALAGAFVGGVAGNQIFGTTTVSLSWDVIAVFRSVMDVFLAPISLASVLSAAIGAVVATGAVWVLQNSSRSAEARTY